MIASFDSDFRELVALAFAILLFVVLLGGVTIDGRHYGVAGCGNHGLEVDWGKPIGALDGGAP